MVPKYTPKCIPSRQRFLIQAFYHPKMAVLGSLDTQNAVLGGKHARIKKPVAYKYTKYSPKHIPSRQRFLIQAFYSYKMAVLGSVEATK